MCIKYKRRHKTQDVHFLATSVKRGVGGRGRGDFYRRGEVINNYYVGKHINQENGWRRKMSRKIYKNNSQLLG